jgi:uncharacterized phiE125 gp8 family phage protein
MALVPILGPNIEPVSVTELKAHLRIDSAAEDAMLASLITTARLQIEAALSLALITQNWSWTFDRWPRRAAVELPLSPVQSILRFAVSQSGGSLTVPPSAYILDGQGIAARLITKYAWPQPDVAALGIAITFAAGFGPLPTDVPAPIRQALVLLATHWYGNRGGDGACSGGTANTSSPGPLPALVSDLLAPYRRPGL